MFRRFLAVAGVVIALTVVSAAPGAAPPPKLLGTVGAGFTITLTKSGTKVSRLKAGVYQLVVRDRSPMHNFVLEKSKGGTFERDVTSVGFTGTKSLVVKLTPGTYKFYCRPHESSMFGYVTVS